MSQWFTPRNDPQWVSRSADGHYAIASVGAMFEAFHIEALWARPLWIGAAPELSEAQRICDEHRERQPASA